MTKYYQDLTGKTFGYLTVIKKSDAERKSYHKKYIHWECVCACGNYKIVSNIDLQRGNVKTCGCRRRKNMPPPAKRVYKYPQVGKGKYPRIQKKSQRNEEIKNLVCEGITLRAIAKQYNISFQRVWEISKK